MLGVWYHKLFIMFMLMHNLLKLVILKQATK